MERLVGQLLACVVFTLVQAHFANAITVRAVAFSAASAPGGSTFSAFGAPLLNDLGQTAFFGTAGADGIWSEGTGSLSLVAKTGTSAAGISGAMFSTFSILARPFFVLNDNGNVAFAAVVSGPGIIGPTLVTSNSRGIWQSTSSGQTLLYRELDTFLQGSNETLSFTGFNALGFNNEDVVSFKATGRNSPSQGGGGITDVLVNRSITETRVAARSGQIPPGLSSPSNFDVIQTSSSGVAFIAINDHSKVAFAATNGGGTVFSSGIWAEDANSMHLVALDEKAAPGMPGKYFAGFAAPSFNDAGHTVFHAIADSSGSDRVGGIWSDRAGTLQLVVGKGDAVPGVSGAAFDSLRRSTASPVPLINHFDRIAFTAKMAGNVTSTNDTALFSDGIGGLSIVAREGAQVPGAPTGIVFSDFHECSASIHCGYSINRNGQVAFLDEERGLFAQDVNGVLQPIAPIGGSLEISPGVFRTITDVAFWGGSGNEDGRESSFNEKGQIAFWARFSGGSGVFVSSAVAIPEPHANVLLALGLIVAGPTRRR